MVKMQQPPWVVQFNGTSKPVLVAPFQGCRRWDEAPDMPALQGKRCIGVDGAWSLMVDEGTKECSLVSLAVTSPSAPTVIALPPLPEDLPDPRLRFGCALSTQTPPDCTVVLDFITETSLLHCRSGDAGWSRLQVKFPEEGDYFDGPITAGQHGKVYATTMVSMVAVDASSPAPAVERIDMRHPLPCPVHERYKCYPVPCSGGDLFLVRCCNFGYLSQVVDMKVFRWNWDDNAWETVETIGGRTFFVGRFSFAVPSAVEAGTQPNCIHVLHRVCGRSAIYTMCLDDMTIRLNVVEGCDDGDAEDQLFWALPTSLGLKAAKATNTIDDISSTVMQRRIGHSRKEEEKGDTMMSTAASPEERQWCDLQADLLQLLVSKISFIDFLHLKLVCKQWNSNASPIHDAKVSPLLITTRPAGGTKEDLLEVFNPVSKKKYNIRLNIPASGLKSQGSQLLHFTKNGWVIVSRGVDHMFFLVNPLKNYPDVGHVITLPPLDVLGLKGLSFSSLPGSPDFVVLAAGSSPDGEVIIIQTWRIGDKEWKEECLLKDDDVPFFMASHSPVFLDGVFYFLDINGRLGVVDPNEDEMEWKVLKKPDLPIRGSDQVHLGEWDYNYLVEWKGKLITIIRKNDDKSVRMFELDQSLMVWSELQGMDDAAVFWDRSNALIVPPGGEDLCNKMFLPNYNETDGGGRMQAFYSFREQCYYPSFYAKEPMNAIWFQPDLDILTMTDQ